MPTKNVYVKPRIFMRYKGIIVYHTYEHGEVEEENKWHFCTSIDSADDGSDGFQFDVRDLDTWVEPEHPPFLTGKNNTTQNEAAWRKFHASGVELKAMKTAIKNAINLGGEKQLYTNA